MPVVLIKCPSPDACGGIIDDFTVALAAGATIAHVKLFLAELPGRPRTRAIRVIRAGRVCADEDPAVLPGTEDDAHPPTLHVAISADAWTERVPVRRPASPPPPRPLSPPSAPPLTSHLQQPRVQPSLATQTHIRVQTHVQAHPPHPSSMHTSVSAPAPAPALDVHRLTVIEQAIRSATLMQSLRSATEVSSRITASLYLWERRVADIWGSVTVLAPAPRPLPPDANPPLEAAPTTPASWYWGPSLHPPVVDDVLTANDALDRLLGLPPCPWDQLALASRIPASFELPPDVELKDEYQAQLGYYVLRLSRHTHSEHWHQLQPWLAYLEWASIYRIVPLRAALSHVSEPQLSVQGLALAAPWVALGRDHDEHVGAQPAMPPGFDAGERPPWHVQPGPDMRLAAEVLAAREALADARARETLAAVRDAVVLHGPIAVRVSFRTAVRMLHILFAMTMVNVLPLLRRAIRPAPRAPARQPSRQEEIETLFGQFLLFSSLAYLALMFALDYRRLVRDARDARDPAPAPAPNPNPAHNHVDQAPRFPLANLHDAFSLTRWAQWVASWGLTNEEQRLHLPVPAPPTAAHAPEDIAAIAALNMPDSHRERLQLMHDVPPDGGWTACSLAASFAASLWPAAEAHRRAALRAREESTRAAVRAWAAHARDTLRDAQRRADNQAAHADTPSSSEEQNAQDHLRHRAITRPDEAENTVLGTGAATPAPMPTPGRGSSPDGSRDDSVRADEEADFDGWPARYPLSLAPPGLSTPYTARVAGDILTRRPAAAPAL